MAVLLYRMTPALRSHAKCHKRHSTGAVRRQQQERLLPGCAGLVDVQPSEAELGLVSGRENNAQARDLDRSLAVIQAW